MEDGDIGEIMEIAAKLVAWERDFDHGIVTVLRQLMVGDVVPEPIANKPHASPIGVQVANIQL